jgi:KipI family sensor histidine kinase inhibitor
MPRSAQSTAQFRPASDNSLLIYFDQHISLATHQHVVKLLRLLELQPISGIVNLHPAYCSVLVKFDALRLRHDEVETRLRPYLDRLDEVSLPEPRHREIPVCYGGEYGPDLAEVCETQSLSAQQAIDLHASATYIVYFLGFVPGFAYLGGLHEALVTPRLSTPRRRVPPGSVGIAGHQSGIYPFATPGGWRLIGRTPVAMFRPDRADMSFLSIGDHVHFTPISPERFAALENA